MPEEKKAISISNELFHPLEVELMDFKYMPDKHAVSLIHPGGTGRLGRARLVNMSPQTALNLLAWLKQEEPELRKLVEEEKK